MISDHHKDKVWSCQVSRKLKTKPKRFNVVPNHTHSSSPQPLYGWLEGLASGLETITVSGNKSSRIHLPHHFLLSSVITRNLWNLILSWHLMISVGMWIFTGGFLLKHDDSDDDQDDDDDHDCGQMKIEEGSVKKEVFLHFTLFTSCSPSRTKQWFLQNAKLHFIFGGERQKHSYLRCLKYHQRYKEYKYSINIV